MDAERDDDVYAELLRLESALAGRDEAALEGGYDAVLHEDFEEIGASGRYWTRAVLLESLVGAPPASPAITGFAIAWISPTVVLARYETGPDRPARRSSLWIWDGGRWRLRFHQGTPDRDTVDGTPDGFGA